MKFIVSFFILLITFQSLAQEWKFDLLITDGSDKVVSIQGMMDGRYVTTFIPEIQSKSVKSNPEVQKALKNPYLVFKERVEKDYIKFKEFSKDFNSCVTGKEWPEKSDCLKKVNYCFNTQREDIFYPRDCDQWRSSIIKTSCANVRELETCLQNEKKAFEVLVGCFERDTILKFRYVARDSTSVWDENVFTLISDSEKFSKFTSCVFTYVGGEFNLLDLRGTVGPEDPLDIILPPKSKASQK